MPMKSCGKGHFYDDSAHSTCPYCGVDMDIGATVGVSNSVAQNVEVEASVTRAAGRVGAPPQRDDGVTRHIWAEKLGGIDPVVGWLVCIEGPDKGRDFRIHSERNFIGRAPTMDIAIAGDASISRENHAVISYNPKKNRFSLAPGDSRGLVYLNDDEVLAAEVLTAYDRIELGASKLLFVPFCGEPFRWSDGD
ncbi:FHA domain-containing protein [Thiorhodovibrio frisius]|nr:FHA domain-containing protein [Thiorhodovibrio frisius]